MWDEVIPQYREFRPWHNWLSWRSISSHFYVGHLSGLGKRPKENGPWRVAPVLKQTKTGQTKTHIHFIGVGAVATLGKDI